MDTAITKSKRNGGLSTRLCRIEGKRENKNKWMVIKKIALC